MTRSPDIPLVEIVDRLEQRLEELVFEFWPGAVKHGSVIYCHPGKDDLGSFQVYLADRGKQRAGHWNRFSQSRGGNVLNLVAYGLSAEGDHKPASYGPAILWAKQWLGLTRPETPAERRRREERRAREAERRRQAALRDAERTHEHVAEIWRGARPIDLVAGDPVVTYLTGEPVWRGGRNIGNRGLDLSFPGFVAPLRFHPAFWNWRVKATFPAMIAAIGDPLTGRRLGVHCTSIDPAGRGKAKAAAKHTKLMRGDAAGGCVPISLGETGLGIAEAAARGRASPLVLAEGIETGLAIAGAAEVRVWSALSIGNIGALSVVIRALRGGISAVILAAENDVKPQAVRERERVLEALEETGLPVSIMRSSKGSDFADLY